MSRHGGKRANAGRKPGSKNAATLEEVLQLGELARSHTETAINALIRIMETGESEAARVSAANAILDRGYGKAKTLPDPVDDILRPSIRVEYVSSKGPSEFSDIELGTIARNGKRLGD